MVWSKHEIISRIASLLVISCVCLNAQAPAFAQNKGNSNGWILAQQGKISGKSTVHITANALKAYKHTAQDTVMCTPPKFLVTLYNQKTQAYFVTPLDKWRAKLLCKLEGALSGSEPAPKRASKTEEINGIKCELWKAVISDKMPVLQTKDRKGPQREISAIDYWVAKDIRVEPNVSATLCYFHGMPKLPGVPIKVTYYYTTGDRYNILETYSAKKATVDVASFKPPTGYRQAKTDMEVFIDKKTAAMMEMFGDVLQADKK